MSFHQNTSTVPFQYSTISSNTRTGVLSRPPRELPKLPSTPPKPFPLFHFPIKLHLSPPIKSRHQSPPMTLMTPPPIDVITITATTIISSHTHTYSYSITYIMHAHTQYIYLYFCFTLLNYSIVMFDLLNGRCLMWILI